MSNSDLSPLLVQYQQEHNHWRRKRRRNRMLAFFAILGPGVLAAFVTLVIWRHTGMVHETCARTSKLCEQITGPVANGYPYWTYWAVASFFALNIVGIAAVLVMVMIWFTRFSRRLYIRGPMLDPERRKSFTGGLWLIAVSTAILSCFTIMEFSLGR